MTKLLKGIITSVLVSIMTIGAPAANAFTLMDLTITREVDLKLTDIKVTDSQSDESYDQKISFCANEDAYIKVGMYESKSGKNYLVNILQDKKLMTKGCHQVSWNGKYSDGKKANEDGNYYYGIEAADKDDSSDTEVVTGWVNYTGNNSNIGDSDEENLIANLKANPANSTQKKTTK